MSEWSEASRRADVVIATALRLEYEAVLEVSAGAVHSAWEHAKSHSGLPVAFRSFEVSAGRPLRVAVALASDMGAPATVNALLPLVEALEPRCIAMCGVCAGRPTKTELGDVVAASRLFYHDTGKQLPGQLQRDLETYQLRPEWKASLAGIDVIARFRNADWLAARPLTTLWRERRALVALHRGDAQPWEDLDQKTWAATVRALQEQQLLFGSELTDKGRRVVEELLFEYQGRLPDLSPWGEFQPFRLHVGPMASGSQVIEDPAMWDSIAQSVRTVLALEMEGAALGQLAHCQRQYGLAAVVMKGVMDFANHGRDDHFKKFAARASAECLLAFLRDHVSTQVVPDVDDLLSTGTGTGPDPAGLPSSLLVARNTVVPWHDRGRAEVLTDLDGWADDRRVDVAVRLLHGPGGTGKTRLAIEWIRRRREADGVAGFLGSHPGDHWLGQLCKLGDPHKPVLIVIDYAESRDDLAALLNRLARYADAQGPRRGVRMLLLARGDGDWWTELRKRSDAIGGLLRHTPPTPLVPLATEAWDRDAIFREAAAVFAAALGKPVVSRPPFALTDPRFDRVLFLHMAALASVEGVAFDASALMSVILDHEERFWQTEAATLPGRAVDVPLARQLVAAATLRGGIPSAEDAQHLYRRLAGRERDRDDDAMIAMLGHVYRRAGETRFLPGLEPDLLGEAMVARVAANGGRRESTLDDWIERVFTAGDDEHALTTAFVVLGRASGTAAAVTGSDGATMRAWIARLLEAELSVRAVLALRAAKIVGQRTAFSPLGDVLAEALERRGSAAVARALEQEQIPFPTVSLHRVASWRSDVLLDAAGDGDDERSLAERARRLHQRGIDLAAAGQREAALAATQEAVALARRLATLNPDAFQPNLAMSLNNLSVDLSDLGQREAALAATQEAVALVRQLAIRNPDAFQSDLATSLSNLGKMLSDLGQREAALVATQEAVALRRQLAIRNPDAFQPDLAMALNNLGTQLSELGQREAALAATQEAVALIRQLATRNPDAFQPNLAATLNNLGSHASDLGQREAALAATQEAVALVRQLATRNPEAFQPNLAMSLTNLGNRLSHLGQREAALAATHQAVALRRQLATRNPDAFQPDLAETLNNLGNQLSDLGQREAALAATQEAVALRRQLAIRNPDAFQSDLAMSLSNLGNRLSHLGQREAALAATQEAVALIRQLATGNPDAFRPPLAAILNNLGNQLSDLGPREAALAATQEALALRRQLATRNPAAFQPDLAMSLNNLGNQLGDLGQREAALAATQEAVVLRRELASRNPEAFQPDLATSLNNLGIMLSRLGQREAALAATQEAVVLRREHATRNPDAFQPALATSLNNLGNQLGALGQCEAALAATQEAVALVRQLATRNPEAFQPSLAMSLNNLGNRLSKLGQCDAALVATQEAVALRRQLASRNPDAFQPALAVSLDNLGNQLGDLGQREAALAATQEAVTLRRQLASRNPDAFQPDLAASLNNLGGTLSNLGQYDAALTAIQEAVALFRHLATRTPHAFQPNLAMSLSNLGMMMSHLGKREAALAVTQEAVTLLRQLESGNPGAFQPDLATSLDNLGKHLSDLGQREAADAATQEAAALRKLFIQ